MRKTIKSVLTAVAVVGMVATGLGLSAAAILDNGKKEVKEKVVLAEAWYFITPTSSTNHSAQTIVGSPASTLSGDCQTSNTGNFCAIRLRFVDEDTPPTLPVNTTVQDAIDDYGATVVLDGSSNPVYAKKP